MPSAKADSSSGGRRGRGARRQTAKATRTLVQGLEREVDRDEEETFIDDRQWLWDEVTNDQPRGKLLKICIVAIKKSREATAEGEQQDEPKLRHGIRFVCNTPDYVMRELLDDICGIMELTMLTNEELRVTFRYVFADAPGLKIPESEMLIREYRLWLIGRWQTYGRRLAGHSIAKGGLDWEWTVGVFAFTNSPETPEGEEDDPVAWMLHRESNKKARIELKLPIPRADIGVTWFLLNNCEETEVELINEEYGIKKKVAVFFEVTKEASKACIESTF